MDILSTFGTILFTSAASVLKDAIVEAVSKRANLREANLRGANLYGANLYGANLRGANLYEANLRGANLYGANLYGANLYGANLRGADLREADLRGADLYGADLREANLYEANLRGAKNAELVIARLSHIPEEGSFIGWKQCKDNVIVKLLIPSDAKRSHGKERKCRASKAEVIEIFGADHGISLHDGKTEYRIGQTVLADSFDENRWETCAPGIHFYITRLEAENHDK